ncbi:hydrolase [Camelimonas fluminis]|uniref:Alpha/beta hydrolase n=1 Tax=Camelimonas fluminis TaxID=1576911 RepID=A0ABV7UKI2_9HYPH|nr:alpha/beta hydrolase [Camelimonas fluminis]GHE54088.1 hydrolase [Camelimonas fluminis]
MTGAANTDFVYRFEPGRHQAGRPLLLLHGTGGDENDLVPLGRMLAPDAPLLSVRGKVLEGGARRFFRRFAEGLLDEDDLRVRADELADFIATARDRHGLASPVALGFSNGANIAAAMLLRRPGALAGAALFRAMAPFTGSAFAPGEAATPAASQSGPVRALVVSGAMDPMVTPDSRLRLLRDLQAAGVEVRAETVPAGHGLVKADLDIAGPWLAEALRA